MSGDIATMESEYGLPVTKNMARPSIIGATIIGHGKSRGSASVGMTGWRCSMPG